MKKSAQNGHDDKDAIATSAGRLMPPFGYFGSKHKIASYMCDRLPPHNAWVEAFCGSAALTLAKAPAPIEVINDINGEVVNLFRQLRNRHRALCRLIALTPYSRQEFFSARHSPMPSNALERARRFLVCSMMAVNGAFGSKRGGFSFSQSYSRVGKEARVSRWYNLPERLDSIVDRLRSVRVERMDARKLMGVLLNRPATLIYLDPPYLGDRVSGYSRDEISEEFHEDLLELANRTKAMVFVSGYDSELYRTMLSSRRGWTHRIIETSTRSVSGRPTQRREVVWMNKHFQHGVRLGRPPIRLSASEIAEKKLNPER